MDHRDATLGDQQRTGTEWAGMVPYHSGFPSALWRAVATHRDRLRREPETRPCVRAKPMSGLGADAVRSAASSVHDNSSAVWTLGCNHWSSRCGCPSFSAHPDNFLFQLRVAARRSV